MSVLDSVPTVTTPGTEHVDVSVVLPCLNEQDSVGIVVGEALRALSELGLAAEVVVVDNNCTDASAEMARQAGARVVTESFPGYGAAIRTGIENARGTVVVMADADCTYPLNRVGELVGPVLAEQADIMVGSRLDAATLKSMPLLHRYVGTPALTMLVRKGVGATGLSDSQSGFRAFRRDIIRSLGLTSTGMEFASEILIRATQENLRVHEVPLGYRERVGESKLSTWSDGMRHLKLILRMSPHLVLWYPGWQLLALATLLSGISVAEPAGIDVAGHRFQPIFLPSMLAMLGSIGILGGAMLGHYLPTASPAIRRRFGWVSAGTALIRLAQTGGAFMVTGLASEVLLLRRWLQAGSHDAASRTAAAGVAQGLVIVGALLVVFALANRLLLAARLGMRVAAAEAMAAEPVIAAQAVLAAEPVLAQAMLAAQPVITGIPQPRVAE